MRRRAKANLMMPMLHISLKITHTHTRGGMWLLRRQTAFYAHNNSTDDKVMATGLP